MLPHLSFESIINEGQFYVIVSLIGDILSHESIINVEHFVSLCYISTSSCFLLERAEKMIQIMQIYRLPIQEMKEHRPICIAHVCGVHVIIRNRFTNDSLT